MSNSVQAEHNRLLLVTPESMPELSAALREGGWAVEERATLLEAVLPLVRSSFDMLLVHQDALPRPPEELKRLKDLQPELPVVALLTSLTDVEGADECIGLPCEPGRLARVLAAVQGRRRESHLLESARTQNRELREKVLEQDRRLAALETALAELSEAAFELQTLFRTALNLFGNVTGAGRLSLMLLEKEAGELRIVEARGLPDDVVAQTRLKLGEGVAGWVAQHGCSLLQKRAAPSQVRADASESYRTDAFLSLPLKIGEEVVGVINMTDGIADEALARPRVEALSALARQTAIWIRYCESLEHARQLSLIDELTGLYNRRYMMRALDRELSRAQRTGEQVGLAMLDIDHFKAYNDIHGHQAGDRLLAEFARVLQDNVRSTDILCRYGGEEFAVILPETGRGGAQWRAGVHFIDRLRSAVAEHEFCGADAQPGGRVTVSAGVAVFPRDASNANAASPCRT